MADLQHVTVEDRIIHYLQLPNQIADLKVAVARLETKMDVVISQDKKTEVRFEDHDSRLVSLEQHGVATSAKLGLGKYFFEILWSIILALIGAGVWLK
ncbi:hypothetical protein [Taklimakanibacter albus]|uniref:Uncharacterized protein n=1 Tax=Taklimakanibacter albus TaxID=2800327 RepID=A0ACC5RG47_9HYPH|nr:hypothetical protein [Aestuariivirga sp. YIM B02566]MBK1871579.1 hypothetical protein [Aestuariivirga sp. YIM B02566]